MTDVATKHDDIDEHVEDEIKACLSLTEPRSFFLFAGAGSGKTRSLVNALKHIRLRHGKELTLRNKRVAIITYTKKARDEIIGRTEYDPLFEVSTIHAFAWSILKGFNHDIREWLRIALSDDIEELREKEAKGRKGTKASAERLADIASKSKRLETLDSVSSFVYNPDGENRGKGSLNHSDVLKMAGALLRGKKTLQRVVRDGFPFILIDESQDTNRHIIGALFAFQAENKGAVALGLFGDMMQRIYADGVDDLGENLPADWATPVKVLNFRCPKRIIGLLSKIREATDGQSQKPAENALDGVVRMYVLPTNTEDKAAREKEIAAKMANIAADEAWTEPEAIKSLILEHKMAARRLGFIELYEPLYGFEPFRTGLRDGTLPCLTFFATRIAPLIEAQHDKFALMRVITKHSLLMLPERLKAAENQKAHLKKVDEAVKSLLALFSENASPTFFAILQNVKNSGLFAIPDVLRPALAGAEFDISNETAEVTLDGQQVFDEETDDQRAERDIAIGNFLNAPFHQIQLYQKYVAGLAQFDTHQGVKGLEFPRVMVIMDDAEAGGFAFKYEKLFSAASAEDKILAATRRLFYVTCSRAERALCLIAYSSNPSAVKTHVVDRGWFTDDEVILLE
ncbi:UvrD-helicase domain-containing protein [Agrobacterium sp. CNPSo 3708]|uniref:UvrD-helicase domain-containing protein n=1 Tax=Agrobacterium sp. CNPSo 3708 TaxID=3028150 RepID=UPI0023639C4E|nr:UvrD-helicase domain-containing protein [Agrobacterium sp. CNPSo 3708]MDD1498979.1 UvrD-helicase domain-containing protein [Agrobacterium sp. CNPSo 3708]